MQEPIQGDSVYFSNDSVPVGDIDYANYEFIPGPNDSVVIAGDTVSPMVWINIKKLWMKTILMVISGKLVIL